MEQSHPETSNAPPLSVSEVSQAVKSAVETAFPFVRVRGEVSRPKRAASGHLYLTLKDERAVIDAVAWRPVAMRLGAVEEGMEVIASGKLTTYGQRSSYQLVLESLELAGEGALLKQLERLKARLAEEGLFAPETKKTIPFLPERIGLITSPTGAVIRDVLHRLADRFPRPVQVWPVAVQGKGAAEQVVAAIQGFNAMPEPQRPSLLIVARGGGSLEDLWTFNEEVVVRAAAASAIPLISAVGHETDTTLIDFAADLRAPTPTAAAELAVPVRRDLVARLAEQGAGLSQAVFRGLALRKERLDNLARLLPRPERVLEERVQSLDLWAERAERAVRVHMGNLSARLGNLSAALPAPRQQVGAAAQVLAQAQERWALIGSRLVSERQTALEAWSGRLAAHQEAHQTLKRQGYVTVHDASGKLMHLARQIKPGEVYQLSYADGQAQVVGAARGEKPAPPKPANKKAAPPKSGPKVPPEQGSLF